MASMIDTKKYSGTIRTAEEARRMCVLGNRILAMDGILDAFGHVSVRNPEDPNSFFIAWATSPEFVTESDLMLCDFDGKILSSDTRRPYGERILHARIYKARPDVNAVCHGHPPTLVPFVCADIPITLIFGVSAMFCGGVPMLREWDKESGLLIGTIAAGDSLAEVLADKPAVLIRSHGIVTVGDSVEQMVTVTGSLDRTADALTRVMQLGAKPYEIEQDQIEKAADVAFSELGIERSWNYKLKKLAERYPEIV